MLPYKDFLKSKVTVAQNLGFEIDYNEINPLLKPHQKDIVKWMVKMGRAACFASFGLGKSIIQLEAVRLTLTRCGGMGLIVIPLGVRQEFVRDAEMLGMTVKFIRRIEETNGEGIYLTNYESVRDGKLDPRLFTVASLDEASCFPAGTMVDTKKGLVPIESLRVGDIIYNANGEDYVKDIFKTEVHRVARIKVGNKTIISSDNHLFFTKKGWIRADHLHPQDAIMETSASVRLLQTGDCSEDVTRSEKEVLQSILLGEMADESAREQSYKLGSSQEENVKSKIERADSREVEKTYLSKIVRMVQNRIYAKTHRAKESKVLQQPMFCSMANESTGKKTVDCRETAHPGGYSEKKPENKRLVRIRLPFGIEGESENRGIEPDAVRSFKGKDGCNTQEIGHSSKMDWWQWSRINEAAVGAFRYIRERMGMRILCSGQAESQGSSHVLSYRHSSSFSENRNRGGWSFPQNSNLERERREENGVFGFARVDSVEILESGDSELDKFREADGKLYFYDITSTQHPSFSVEGLLVHNCLRGFGGTKTFREFMAIFAGDRKTMDNRILGASVPYRFVATATPSPNEYIELLAYSAFLGVMDVSQAKTRFFKRDSTKADNLTLHAHKEEEFWLWISSWALFVQKPSDLGHSDEGYVLPELEVHWHELGDDMEDAGIDRHGQKLMFKQKAIGLELSAKEKRESLPRRISKMMELRALDPDANRIIWHDLEAERQAIQKAIKGVSVVYGSQDDESKERNIIGFSNGEIQELAGKPMMLGSGCNFQRHCNWAIFLGIGFKFNDFIQAIHRLYRFLQTKKVRVDIIYTEAESGVREILENKWIKHNEMVDKMTSIIKEYGLNNAAIESALQRKMGTERIEVLGNNFTLVNNDCVDEVKRLEDNSIDLVLTSIPFSTQYEYSPNFADFGHTDTNEHFFEQMDYLTPDLLRTLKPGRNAVIHVKDRIVPGGMTGLGYQTVYPFHCKTIEHYKSHGFGYMGMITVVTDVVRENNQTYRLGWSEVCKDSSKISCGMPEYLLIFRKTPTDTSDAYADDPVKKTKEAYSRSRWQTDAHGFWRSAGERLMMPEELETLDHDVIFKWFRDHNLQNVYSYESHVKIGETIDGYGRLPVTFMLLQPPSWADDVWTDVARMRTLNMLQQKKGKEQHLCPMQFDIADRIIERFTNPGDLVLDPFSGIGSVGYRALLKQRKYYGVELSARYFADSCYYLESVEKQNQTPTLFDLTAA